MTPNGPPRICKDCKALADSYDSWYRSRLRGENVPEVWTEPLPPRKRKAPHPGPRCVSHHREIIKARKAMNHEKRVQETYGLEKGEYAQLYEFQGGVCALCRRATGASRRLAVDHDHATGHVRGLLCSPCNRLLGHARDKIAYFERCADYLGLTPYARMRMGAPFEEYTDGD